MFECVLEALSSMMMLMTIETISRDRISILTNILNLFKRSTAVGLSRYWVTQYLASFLSVVPQTLLEPVIDNLFLILHDMVIIFIYLLSKNYFILIFNIIILF